MVMFHLLRLLALRLIITPPPSVFVSASCSLPEGDNRICYGSSEEAEPQNVSVAEIQFIARYLRSYQAQRGNPKFYFMNGTGADDCAEWPVTSRGTTAVFAKLVGDAWAAVTFLDIARTLDGGEKGTAEDKSVSLVGCDTDGGQMGVMVNTSDPLYWNDVFLESGLVNKGILIKVVHNNEEYNGE